MQHKKYPDGLNDWSVTVKQFPPPKFLCTNVKETHSISSVLAASKASQHKTVYVHFPK